MANDKHEPLPPAAFNKEIIFIIKHYNFSFTGAGGGNDKVFEELAALALGLERLKDMLGRWGNPHL